MTKIPFHTCQNESGQTLEIYSLPCENFYRVAGYHSDGRTLFDGITPSYIIDYWEVNAVVTKFTGRSIKNALPPSKAKDVTSNTKPRVLEAQCSMAIPAIPIHSKVLTQKEIDSNLNLILGDLG